MTQYLSYEGLQKYDEKLKNWVRNQDSVLQQLIGNESVSTQITNAIAALINSAPTEFDTLKEVSDWIQSQKELNSEMSLKLNKVIDIEPVSSVDIDILFLTPVTLQENQSISDAIGNLQEGEKLVISSGITITDDFSINNDCVIEAEGVTFSGNISIAQDVTATIVGAVFSGQVTVV